ncbi:hypothetical protein JRQ81_006498 [Phrynocephalus forsythii]|uniref:Uncharacterized protein n=1 Tax=Phrynocephalus forsythii TaxID=171643 RepID=A0A9Q0XFJ1_9SAUR|nr:hypothetical protein JRQ81_006498 [Phrynocephalus forsythii]
MSGRREKSPKAAAAAAASSSSSSEAGSGPPAAKKRAKREPRAEFSAAVREPALREKVAAAWDGRRRRARP